MSHFTRVQTRIADQEALVLALAENGWRPEAHDSAVRLRGFMGASRRGHVVVRREQLPVPWSDLGFERGPDGVFQAWADSELLAKDPHLLDRLTARTAYHSTVRTLGEQGFQVSDEARQKDGSVRLVLRRFA
jgi:hypothetical protein